MEARVEPRWDYKCKAPGQGTSRESTSWLNRGSNAEYPARISRIGSSIGECTSSARVEGGCTPPHRHLLPLQTRLARYLPVLAGPARSCRASPRSSRFELVLSKGRVRAVNRVAGEGRGRRLGSHEARTGDGLPTADPILSDPIRGVEAELYVCGVRERLRESTKSRPRRPRHRLGREGYGTTP